MMEYLIYIPLGLVLIVGIGFLISLIIQACAVLVYGSYTAIKSIFYGK